MTFEPFQQTLLKLCNRGGMKLSKMSQGRNVSKNVGNHCSNASCAFFGMDAFDFVTSHAILMFPIWSEFE